MDDMIIDSTGRVYVFWHGFEHKPMYKYYEEGQWSSMITLYESYEQSLIFREAALGLNNSLHCILQYTDPNNDTSKAAYIYYNHDINEWTEPEVVGQYQYNGSFEDIVVDSYNNPHLVWREEHYITTGVDATLYKTKTGDTWGETQLIVQNTEDIALQNIDIKNNKPLIVDVEEIGSSDNMMLYRQDYSGNWYGSLIFNYFRADPWILFHDNEFQYLLFERKLDNDDFLDIFITKTPLDSLTTGINMQETTIQNKNLLLCQNTPNPFNRKTQISYNLPEPGQVSIIISELSGKIICNINLGEIGMGEHTFIWDGTTDKHIAVKPGIYFYTVKINDFLETKPMIMIK